jgi:hypothetical protein
MTAFQLYAWNWKKASRWRQFICRTKLMRQTPRKESRQKLFEEKENATADM